MEKESNDIVMFNRQSSVEYSTSSSGISHIELKDIQSSTKPDSSTVIEVTKQIRALLIEKETKNNVHLWTVNNCADITEAFDLFDSATFADEIKDNDTVFVANICIDDEYVDLNSREIRELSKKCREKSVVILLTSKIGEKFSLFWKSKKVENFLELKQYTQKLFKEDERVICEFILDFLSNSLDSGHFGLHSAFSCSTNAAIKVEMHLLADKNDHNLLLIAAQSGNAKASKTFLKLGLNPYTNDSSVSAQSLALANGHYDILLILLQSNLTYPDSIELSKCPVELKKFIRTSLQLHKAIKAGDGDKVDEIVSKKHSRHFYNLSNVSAPKVAIENEKIDMYEKLLVNKVLFSPHENVTDIMEHLNDDDKRYIREVHFKHSIDMPEKHINTLVANSYVGHEEVSNVEDKLGYIRNAFKILNENPSIRIILMVVAAARKFRIIFDFNRDSVEFVDPTVDSNTVGLFYLSGRIYIGARQLLKESTKHLTLATIAHELCHFSMNLVFQNHANPYTTKDNLLMQEVEEVSQNCQSQHGKEDIVDLVYEMYSEDMHHAEMIVRAPHMIVHYANNPAKLKETRQIFEPLYNLYENRIVPEMKKALPEIESRIDKEMAKKDKKISNLKKILVSCFIVFIAILTGSIYYASQKKAKSYEFNDLELDERQQILDFDVIYADAPVKLGSLFQENSSTYGLLGSSIHKDIITGEQVSIDLNNEKFKHLEPLIEFNWKELSESLKTKFLNSTCNFQGAKVLFSDFYAVYNETFQYLTSEMIKRVLKNGYMTIGLPIPDVPKQCVDRKFLETETSKNVIRIFEFDQNVLLSNLIQETKDKYAINDTVHAFELKDFLHPGTVFILSDFAGTGKTVSSKQFGQYVKQVNPLRWVTFVQTGIFEKSVEKCQVIDEMFSLQTTFEKAVFFEACFTQNAVIIWDSYEDQQEYRLTENLKEFHSTYGNSLMFNNRPNVNELETIFQKNSNTFVPLNEEEQIQFIKCQAELKKNGVNESAIIEVQSLLTHLHKRSRGSPLGSDITTPFILELIASDYILEEDKNLYEFYMKILEEMLGTWTEKTFSKELKLKVLKSEADLIDIFETLALGYEKSLLFYSVHLKMKDLNIFRNVISYNSELLKMLSRTDIVLKDPNYKLFSYKTFTDFFIAKYLLNSLWDKRTCGYADEEIELRLELFFYYVQVYGHNQWLVTEFLSDFLEVESKKTRIFSFYFCPNVKRVLQTKFRRIFVDLLGTNRPEIFKFLIKFFGNDKEVLKMLLLVDQNVTFYDEIFNLVNNAYYINPDNILDMIEPYLRDEDPIGNNEKESIFVSSYFYRKSSVPKIHRRLGKFSNDLNVCDIISLSDKQWINLLESPLSSVVFIDEMLQKNYEHLGIEPEKNRIARDVEEQVVDNPTANSQDFGMEIPNNTTLNSTKVNNQISNVRINEILCPILPIYWTKVNDQIMDKIKFFGNEIYNYLQVSASNSFFQKPQILKVLLEKSELFLNLISIRKMVQDFNLLHKAAENFQNYQIIWKYIEKHIEDPQDRRMIAMKNAEGMYKYDPYNINGTIEKPLTYRTRYFERTPLKPFHIALLSSNDTRYMDFVMESHKSIFKVHEIMEIMKASKEFLYEIATFTDIAYCLHLSKYLKEDFEDEFINFQMYLYKNKLFIETEGNRNRHNCAGALGFQSFEESFIRIPSPLPPFLKLFCYDGLIKKQPNVNSFGSEQNEEYLHEDLDESPDENFNEHPDENLNENSNENLDEDPDEDSDEGSVGEFQMNFMSPISDALN